MMQTAFGSLRQQSVHNLRVERVSTAKTQRLVEDCLNHCSSHETQSSKGNCRDSKLNRKLSVGRATMWKKVL